MSEEKLAQLRRNVAGHSGAARARPLLDLTTALADRYWRIGPGTPAAAPYLNEAIEALDEAYDLLEAGEFLRGQVAGQLGWLLAMRNTVHGGAESDRETGIRLLEEALSFSQLPPMMQATCRLTLGQLLLTRVTGRLQSGDLGMRLMGGGMSRAETADADRAVACFRQVADGPAVSPQLTALAGTMLEVAQALRSLTGGFGGAGGLDFGRMMQTLGTLQDLQRRAAAGAPGAGAGLLPNIFDADTIAAADPLDRPVAVVDGAPPVDAEPPPGHPAETPAAPPPAPSAPARSAAELRAALLGRLPGPGFAPMLQLLDEAAARPDVHTVDELVALAGALVEAPGTVDTDQLLLAVALYLRGLVDDGGWGEDSGADDLGGAGDRLLAAADGLAAASGDAVAVAVRLGVLLDRRRPGGEVLDRLAARFGPVAEALRAVGAGGLLFAGAGEPLLLCAETGRLRYAAAGSEWPGHILVAGAGSVPAGSVPAGSAPDGFAPDGPTVSHVSCGDQVVRLAGRTRRPVGAAAVFLANPRGDRRPATLDALQLRRTFYPGSVGLGETAENIDGPGTPAQVRSRLDASMLQLGCGITAAGGLELAGSTVLDPAEVAAAEPAAAGGLAVLPPTATGAAALTDALLASRFVGVVGFRDEVPAELASLIYLQLHGQLVDEGRDPAGAVGAVRRWLADSRRTPPEYLPPWLAEVAGSAELADPACWGSLVHHGV